MNEQLKRSSRTGPEHVIIIGGGASGVLLAALLLRQCHDRLRVTIIEGRHMLGCGVAYSTEDADHLLNTRVANMSAYPDKPDHFVRWLQVRQPGQQNTSDRFVSRKLYGEYMSGLLTPWRQMEEGVLNCIHQTCRRLDDLPDGVAAHLDDGRVVVGDIAVLATGHALPGADPAGLVQGAWEAVDILPKDERVVVIGSGLSMVDHAVSLLKSGHEGEIVVVSRRGQLPREHATGTALDIPADQVPLGAPVSQLMSWLRHQVKLAEAKGGTWRDAVDGLRPHLRRIWRSLPIEERKRFLRHGASWWEVHRHRLPPESSRLVHSALRKGQIRLISASFQRGERSDAGQLQAIIRRRGSDEETAIAAARIIDCRGIRHDPEKHATPLIADLLQQGAARLDPLRLGLDVSGDCELLDREGTPNPRIYAMGPVSRAAFWEITAIPDIRDQAKWLAGRIVSVRSEPSLLRRH
ncbi:FAD/NAD(P)-binding protein [Paracoccus sp. 11-3]|uniref:FAD/NAD(P)-binding protein n=1 Tax=Paracoccus amoyensis TaxID=2760093 RepID=A0A926G672_9RHOB|nr:FAD/NAD(P)-binding protein [Paracoccus amoyensis]MBC9245298.1 FAD/NAD(P)-binding protein [Paracoccus amoyensis]